jgi:hypothetical protein
MFIWSAKDRRVPIFAPAKAGTFPLRTDAATPCADHYEYSLCPCAAVER